MGTRKVERDWAGVHARHELETVRNSRAANQLRGGSCDEARVRVGDGAIRAAPAVAGVYVHHLGRFRARALDANAVPGESAPDLQIQGLGCYFNIAPSAVEVQVVCGSAVENFCERLVLVPELDQPVSARRSLEEKDWVPPGRLIHGDAAARRGVLRLDEQLVHGCAQLEVAALVRHREDGA